jgi:phosphoglucosamine mutase
MAGVVVSASHNPFDDNGIKFFGPDGKKLSDTEEEAIESTLEVWETLPQPVGEHIGRIIEAPELIGEYCAQVKATAPSTLHGMRLVLDCANGAASWIAPALFEDLGAKAIPIHASPNGLNINANCGSTKPADLCAQVKASGADAGLAFDGDCDRVMMCDERGEIVDGDKMMAICAFGMQEQGKLTNNVVVATIMSNAGLEVALEQAGIRLLRTNVGDRYVAEAMARSGAAIGGEQSGHLLLPHLTPTGDGMVTGLQILGRMRATGCKLSELADAIPRFPQILRNIRVRNRTAWQEVDAIQEAIAAARTRLGKPEWLSVRASGTEPMVRVMAQDRDGALVEEIVNTLCALIDKCCND